MIPEFTQFRIFLRNFETQLEQAISDAKMIAEENRKLKDELSTLREMISKLEEQQKEVETKKEDQ